MVTALEFKASFGRRKLDPEEAAELYRLRDIDVAALVRKGAITVEDVQTLEWGGRFIVANEHFDICTDVAKHALLHDSHHGVRAAAALFVPRHTARAAAPARSTTQASIAETALAIMNGKKRIETLHGDKSAAGIEAMITSTHPLALLERAENFIAGFEGDELQESVDQLLADLRAILKPAE